MLVLHGALAWVLLALVWIGAAAGVSLSLSWVRAPRGLVVCCYLALGWAAVLALPQLVAALAPAPLLLIVGGGLLYSIGALVYTGRRPDPWPVTFGFHEVFHARWRGPTRWRSTARSGDPLTAALAWRSASSDQTREAPHFLLEESILLPALPEGDAANELAERVRADHRYLRDAARELSVLRGEPTVAILAGIGARLRTHVQLEERKLFPCLEGSLDAGPSNGSARSFARIGRGGGARPPRKPRT
jgi:hypothetical protein